VAALGNLCEAGLILQRGSYIGIVPGEIMEEAAVARRRYHEFQGYIAQHYTAVVDGKSVSVFWVFGRSLVEFMAGLVTYKTAKENFTSPGYPGCESSAVLKKRIQKFFTTEYPELLECWKELVSEGHNSFYWTGPAFSLAPLTDEISLRQIYEVDGWEIYRTISEGATEGPTPVESDDEEVPHSADEEEDAESEASDDPSWEGSQSSRYPGPEIQKARVSKRKLDAGHGGKYLSLVS